MNSYPPGTLTVNKTHTTQARTRRREVLCKARVAKLYILIMQQHTGVGDNGWGHFRQRGCLGKLPQGYLSAETSRTKYLSLWGPCYHVISGWVWARQEEFLHSSCTLLLAPHALILHWLPELSVRCSSGNFGQGIWSTEKVFHEWKKSRISTYNLAMPSLSLTVDYSL